MPKFAQVLDKFMALKYQLAVWDEVMNFLGPYTAGRDGIPPTKEISTEMGEVPVEHVDEVKDLVDLKTQELREELAKLGDTEIKDDGKKGKKSAKGPRKKSGAEGGKATVKAKGGARTKPARLTLPKARGRGKSGG